MENKKEQVRVYRNLHADCWSVQAKQGKNNGWIVVSHEDSITLVEAKLTVGAGARDRVRQEGHKNVHAFITGFWTAENPELTTKVTYNPYKYDSFVLADTEEPITEAEILHLGSDRKVYI